MGCLPNLYGRKLYKMKIGITQGDTNFENYPRWIKGDNHEIEVVILSYKDGNISEANECDAFVFSGGIDVHPSYYNSENLFFRNNPEGIFNEKRDAFEKNVFSIALEKKAPVLGICRGMQFINVLLGGGMIQDLEDVGKQDHKSHDKVDGEHGIIVDKQSEFFKITGVEKGRVNSAHHQALGKIAAGLKVVAVSEDDVVEAVEYEDKIHQPWMLCVQWHPERLKENEQTTPFTKNIREAFLASIKK
jgi:putative glutamine amidotransferase